VAFITLYWGAPLPIVIERLVLPVLELVGPQGNLVVHCAYAIVDRCQSEEACQDGADGTYEHPSFSGGHAAKKPHGIG
jgi:hypothetical protein